MTPDTLQDRLKGLLKEDESWKRDLKAQSDILRAVLPFCRDEDAAVGLVVAINSGRIPHIRVAY